MFSPRCAFRVTAPAVAAVLFCWGLTAPAAHAATAREDDFNGDGYPDLVVSAPGGTVGGAAKAGYIVVMWGSAHGLAPNRRTVISRSTSGIPGSATAGEGFGWHVSSGDLDSDHYTDLVINAAHGEAGSVILWGSAKGLTGAVAIPGYTTLSSTGDYNGDTRTDLALIQTHDFTGDDPGGSKAVVWNNPVSRKGLPASQQAFGGSTTDYYNVEDIRTGDANGDGRDDLALVEYTGDGGYGVEMYYGGDGTDLTTPAAVMTVASAWTGLDLGDVNGDGADDLVVGDAGDGAGTVVVAYGSPTGISPSNEWSRITQNTPEVPGADEDGDRFGASLAVLDTNADDISDVVVGVPGESVGTVQQAGAVVVLPGSQQGPTGTGATTFTQNTKGVPGAVETGDRFGAELRLLNTNGPDHPELFAAAPQENGGEGAVWTLNGTGSGLVTAGSQVFGPRAAGTPVTKALFGSGLH